MNLSIDLLQRLKQSGDIKATERVDEHCEAVAALQNDYSEEPELLVRYGQVLREAGKALEAERILRRCLEVKPNSGAAYRELGLVYGSQGRQGKAIEALQQATVVDGQEWLAAEELGLLLEKMGQLQEALNAYQFVLQRRTLAPRALDRLGRIIHALGMQEQAFNMLIYAAAQRPEWVADYQAMTWDQIGNPPFDINNENILVDCINKSGIDYDLLIQFYRRLIDHHPDAFTRHPAIIALMLSSCDWQDYENWTQQHIYCMQQGINPTGFDAAFTNLPAITGDPEVLAGISRGLAQHHIKNKDATVTAFDFSHKSKKSGKIRVAYVLPYTAMGSLPFGIAEFLKHHDRERFDIFGYINHTPSRVEFGHHLEQSFDLCRFFNDVAAPEAAQQIYADDIDILIDTYGHTVNSFHHVLAYKPAPVQVNFYGFVETTGAPYMDYLISDERQVPAALAAHYTEKLAYLPESLFVAERLPIDGAAFSRADMNLPEEAFVFCNFNHQRKFNPPTWDWWMTILKQVPGSVLWLGMLQDNIHAREALRRETAQRGVDPARLIFATEENRQKHLNRLPLADLCLDSYFQSGGINAVDSVMAGVPVLAYSGDTSHCRNVVSINHAAGVGDYYTCQEQDEFISKAVALAGPERGRLDLTRRHLEETRDSCPLYDLDRYTRHLEKGYEMMWQRHQRGEAVEVLHIPAMPR